MRLGRMGAGESRLRLRQQCLMCPAGAPMGHMHGHMHLEEQLPEELLAPRSHASRSRPAVRSLGPAPHRGALPSRCVSIVPMPRPRFDLPVCCGVRRVCHHVSMHHAMHVATCMLVCHARRVSNLPCTSSPCDIHALRGAEGRKQGGSRGAGGDGELAGCCKDLVRTQATMMHLHGDLAASTDAATTSPPSVSTPGNSASRTSSCMLRVRQDSARSASATAARAATQRRTRMHEVKARHTAAALQTHTASGSARRHGRG